MTTRVEFKNQNKRAKGKERESQKTLLITENKAMVTRAEAAKAAGNSGCGWERAHCDKHRVTEGSADSLYRTPETSITCMLSTIRIKI